MPTVKGIPGPYRLFFYSFDCREPRHVHVLRDQDTCKFWLEPITLARNSGFSASELGRIRRTIQENSVSILEAWREHCE